MTGPLIPKDLPEKFHTLFVSYHNEVVRLTELNNALRRLAFGRSSERVLPGELIVPAGSLFNEVEMEGLQPEVEAAAEENKGETEVKPHARKAGGRNPLPADLPRVEKIIDLPEDKKNMPTRRYNPCSHWRRNHGKARHHSCEAVRSSAQTTEVFLPMLPKLRSSGRAGGFNSTHCSIRAGSDRSPHSTKISLCNALVPHGISVQSNGR